MAEASYHRPRGGANWWDTSENLKLWLAYRISGNVSPLGTWKDASAAEHDITLVADADVDSNGMNMDGTGDYGTAGDADDFSFTDGSNDLAFTWACWINMNDASGFILAVKRGNVSGVGWEYAFQVGTDDTLKAFLYNTTSGTPGGNRIKITGNSTLTAHENAWIQVGLTYDGSESQNGLNLYVNGSPHASTKAKDGSYAGQGNSGNALLIGASPTYIASNGSIDDVRMYRGLELTAAQMLELYNGTKLYYGL